MKAKPTITGTAPQAANTRSQTRLVLRLNLHVRWVWEVVDSDNHVVNSSPRDFGTRRECELDAKRHGFRPVVKSAVQLTNMRRRAGLSQAEFWERVGVTQSGGSRYEQGRLVRKPIRMLLALAYGTEKERQQVVRQLEKQKEAAEANDSQAKSL